MKTQNPQQTSCRTGWLSVALFVVVLGILFARSFLPEYVHFSNDGPLGQQNAASLRLPSAFIGVWYDTNDVGFNSGSLPLNISMFMKWVLGPVYFAKFYAALALLFMSVGALCFFRTIKLTPWASALGALATVLSANFFAGACWSVAAVEIAIGLDFLALALIMSNCPTTPWLVRWCRIALAGLCVGLNVIEAADVGALCSILVAIIIFYRSLIQETNNVIVRAGQGIAQVAVVAMLAGFIAIQTIIGLITVSVTGIAGTGQDEASKQAHWDFATQWSLPKKETLGFFIPGLFGYRMDTPKDMSPLFSDGFKNGAYWGGMGRDPSIDRFFDSGSTGSPPPGGMRFGYAGFYCGILVVLVALWVIAQSFRARDSLLAPEQKKFVWFWVGVLVLSVLFAWGRFAPMFYGALYHLPYFSTVRNPTKFTIFLSLAVAVLFAYGMDLLNRRYLEASGPKSIALMDQLSVWWKKSGSFDHKWTIGCAVGVLVAVIGWIIYDVKSADFITYLQKVGFSDENPGADYSASAIAAFSLHEAAWFVGLLVVAVGLLLLSIAGYFSGQRARLGMILIGAFVIFDLGRADLPWVIHWDYKQKYEVDSLNPVVDLLRQQPYEHRVAGLPFEPQQQLRGFDYLFGGSGIYRIEWMQHHFPYYNVQSLDLIQMPRMPEDMKAFQEAFIPSSPEKYPEITRRWELTNTRYLLGAAGFINVLNQQFDPGKNRFRIAQRFDIVTKPGVIHPSELEEFTAVTNSDGELALFDFTGALPRVKLYGNWQVNTNDQANLATLSDLNFDPAKTVLVSTPQASLPSVSTNENTGTVDFTSYAPTHIVLAAEAAQPSILLLNDKYDSHWKVTVDGQPANLLRCNFLMRGVYLQPGKHTIVFGFSMADRSLNITIAALILAVVLALLLLAMCRKKSDATPA